MSIEDRVRAATRARTTLIRDVRPLELPDELPARAPRTRRARRWLTWGAPIGAAALVTALALVLVMLRQADGPQSAPAAPVPAAPAAASIPRYYVALADTGSTSAQTEAVVGDDRTGRRLAVIPPSPGQNFSGVTAAADDRTFVLSSYLAAQQKTTWYLLRLTPGTAHPAQLTKLPIKPVPAHVTGLALSPDGRELAVMFSTAPTSTNTRPQLSIYSLSSGVALDTWSANAVKENSIGPGANAEGLSWVDGDRSVAFRWFDPVPGGSNYGVLTVRTLDVTAAGHDLLADSRLVLQVPFAVVRGSIVTSPCHTSLAASDGRTVVCSTVSVGARASSAACLGAPPSFVSYSTATGKPLQVLYRYQGQCVNGQALLLWTDPSGSQAIGFILLVKVVKGKNTPSPTLFGVAADGHFTPLPAPVVPEGADLSSGGIAF